MGNRKRDSSKSSKDDKGKQQGGYKINGRNTQKTGEKKDKMLMVAK